MSNNATARRPIGESGLNQVRDTARALNITVSQNVRRHLTEQGITRGQLAEALGLTRDQMTNRMIGRSSWLVEEVARAGELLGLEHHGAALLIPSRS